MQVKNRGDLTDKQWEKIKPLLPPQKPKTGRPNSDHPTIVNGILWILRTGAPWRDLPTRYGSHGTVSSRFYRWEQKGVWQLGGGRPLRSLDTKRRSPISHIKEI